MSLYGGEAELSLFRWGAVGIAGVAGLVLGAGMLAIAIGLFRFYAACCGFRRVHWIGNPMRTFENSYGAFRGTVPFYRRMERFTVAQEARVRSAAPLSAGTCANSTS